MAISFVKMVEFRDGENSVFEFACRGENRGLGDKIDFAGESGVRGGKYELKSSGSYPVYNFVGVI